MAVQKSVDGPLGRLSQQGFELGEQLLDRIEVRAVGRKVAEARPCGLDQGGDLRSRMAGQVVHDDDVAGPEFWNEELLDIGLERGRVDRPVEDERRDEAVETETANKGGVFR